MEIRLTESIGGIQHKRLTHVLFILLGTLLLRLVYLQVIRGSRYARLSERNRVRQVILPAPRGRIFDRNGVPIADTRPSFTLSVIPTELTDSTLALLARLLNVSEEELRRVVEPVARFPSPVNVKRDLDFATVACIEENRFRLPGVLIRVDPIRSYPKGSRYCHVTGHLGEINEAELKKDTTYRRLDLIGRSGIEREYETWLRGRDGYEYAEVDARGHEIGPLPEKRPEPPTPGKDIYLTIDDRLQELACELVAPFERAAVVGLEVKTGAVLCLVSRPEFDPNVFIGPVDPVAWEALVSNPSKPFFNRVIASCYPPGSVLKPIVALAALHSRVVRPATTLDPCTGQFRYGNRVFKCWSAHGRLNLLEAITHSCNSYFYQLGLKLGLDSLISYCRMMGLGQPTGIDLPGEKAGNIPSRAWLDSRYGKGKWTSGVILNFAIGQGEILATPLQLAMVYAAIANNGVCCQPHLVARIDSAGRTVLETPINTRTIPINQNDLKAVKLALTRVVEYGTGRTARMEEITIAGKTGTAQNPPRPDHAWFVGYAPAEEPEVVFAALVENAGHGGAVAAPIVGQLVRAWFSLRDD